MKLPRNGGTIAFFDLDRTVISVNSATGWIRREVRLGYLPRRRALRGLMWVGAYQLGFARMEDALRQAVASLEGDREDDIRARTTAFWREEVAAAIRPGARRAIARHREAGDLCVLLTSSSPYLSRAAADELDLDGFLCNHFEVRDGRFTGVALDPLCYGPGKILHARAYADERGVPLEDCVFYTDSYSDLPVMEAVGRPVAIAPDPRLAREARKRGWAVEDWD